MNVLLSTETVISLYNGVLSAKVLPTPYTKKEHMDMEVYGEDNLQRSTTIY